MVLAGGLETEEIEGTIGVVVSGEVGGDEVVSDEFERAGGGDFGVELADGAGGEVAGVGEGFFAELLLASVKPVEVGFENNNFATDFDMGIVG